MLSIFMLFKIICYNPGQCLFRASTVESNITSELQDPGGIFENVDTAPVPCRMNLKVLNKGISWDQQNRRVSFMQCLCTQSPC